MVKFKKPVYRHRTIKIVPNSTASFAYCSIKIIIFPETSLLLFMFVVNALLLHYKSIISPMFYWTYIASILDLYWSYYELNPKRYPISSILNSLKKGKKNWDKVS